MRFTNAGIVEQTVWDMRLADLPRGQNRALIDRLANGFPPYSRREQDAGRIKTNVNFLEFPELLADARRAYYNAFLKTEHYFNVTLDYGPVRKRREWGRIITRELNRILKNSPRYFEFLRSQIAMTVEHGIGPGVWQDRHDWCLKATGLGDMMIPSGTLLTMENLPYLAIYKEWTAMELYRMTHRKHVDPGWKMDVVDAAIKWADEQGKAQVGYSDLYAPEKVEERFKQDLGFYATDAVPSIQCWDFYFWSDFGKQAGWRRRMIIDTPCAYEVQGKMKAPKSMKMPEKNQIGQEHGKWLYAKDDDKPYADSLGQIVNFQFGDASAVAPHHYHSVRGLGWLLYAPCHLQNRYRCRLSDAAFEALLQYFRTTNEDDKERILKIDLHHLGVIPSGVNFVKPEERWKIDQQLAALMLGQMQERMQKAAAQYREGRDETTARKEKTATEIMAEVNASNALVGAMLLQAYEYFKFQGLEIARRFCIKNSESPGVRSFRVACMRQGVPAEYLNSALWTVTPERVLGSGNKTLQIAMAEKLMAIRGNLDPQSQRDVDRQYVLANTDDPALAARLVPIEDEKEPTNTPHDAMVAVASILKGMPIPPKPGESQIEVIETWLEAFAKQLEFLKAQGIPSPADLMGLENLAANILTRVDLVKGDRSNAMRVKGYVKAVSNFMRIVKAMQQTIQQMAKQQAGKNGQAEAAMERAKLEGEVARTRTKLEQSQASHAQRTREREMSSQQRLRHAEETHGSRLRQQTEQAAVDRETQLAKTAADIENDRLKAEAAAANSGKEGEE